MLHHTKNLLACLTCRKATLPAQCRIVKRRRYRQTRVHIRTNKQWYDLRNKAFSFMFCVLCSSLILHIHNSIKSIPSQIGEAKSSQPRSAKNCNGLFRAKTGIVRSMPSMVTCTGLKCQWEVKEVNLKEEVKEHLCSNIAVRGRISCLPFKMQCPQLPAIDSCLVLNQKNGRCP